MSTPNSQENEPTSPFFERHNEIPGTQCRFCPRQGSVPGILRHMRNAHKDEFEAGQAMVHTDRGWSNRRPTKVLAAQAYRTHDVDTEVIDAPSPE